MDKYRYGFNGQEREEDAGSFDYDFGARMYDSRLARFLSVDKLNKKYHFLSHYQFAANNPILLIDYKGNDPILLQKSTNSENVLVVLVDANDVKINLQELALSNWDYVFVTNFEDATKWLEDNYNKEGSVKIKNLVIGTHGNGRGSIFLKKNTHVIAEDFDHSTNDDIENIKDVQTKENITKRRFGAQLIKGIGQYLSKDAKVLLTACGVGNDPKMMEAIYNNLGGGDIEVYGNKDFTVSGVAGSNVDIRISKNLARKKQEGWVKQSKDGLRKLDSDSKLKISRFKGIREVQKKVKQ